jgi:hypothetical protein
LLYQLPLIDPGPVSIALLYSCPAGTNRVIGAPIIHGGAGAVLANVTLNCLGVDLWETMPPTFILPSYNSATMAMSMSINAISANVEIKAIALGTSQLALASLPTGAEVTSCFVLSQEPLATCLLYGSGCVRDETMGICMPGTIVRPTNDPALSLCAQPPNQPVQCLATSAFCAYDFDTGTCADAVNVLPATAASASCIERVVTGIAGTMVLDRELAAISEDTQQMWRAPGRAIYLNTTSQRWFLLDTSDLPTASLHRMLLQPLPGGLRDTGRVLMSRSASSELWETFANPTVLVNLTSSCRCNLPQSVTVTVGATGLVQVAVVLGPEATALATAELLTARLHYRLELDPPAEWDSANLILIRGGSNVVLQAPPGPSEWLQVRVSIAAVGCVPNDGMGWVQRVARTPNYLGTPLATVLDRRGVRVSWPPSTMPGLLGYRVSLGLVQRGVPSNVVAYDWIDGLPSSATLTFRVRAISASTVSEEVSVTVTMPRPLPPAPVNLSAVVLSDSQVQVSWANTTAMAAGDAHELLVQCIGAYCLDPLPHAVPATARNQTILTLAAGSRYQIQVVRTRFSADVPCSYSACRSVSSVPSETLRITLPEARPDPPVFSVDIKTINNLMGAVVSWNPPLAARGVITNYTLVHTFTKLGGQRSFADYVVPGRGPLQPLETVVSPLEFFSNHCVAVASNNGAGSGHPSQPNCFRTPESVPTEPRLLTILQRGSRSVIVSWREPDPPNGVILNYHLFYWTGMNVSAETSEITLSLRLPGSARSVVLDGLDVSAHQQSKQAKRGKKRKKMKNEKMKK